jgi:hypothetical protein
MADSIDGLVGGFSRLAFKFSNRCLIAWRNSIYAFGETIWLTLSVVSMLPV